MKTPSARKRALLLALTVTVIAATAATRDELLPAVGGVSGSVQAAPPRASSAPDTGNPARLPAGRRAAITAEPGNLFESRTWQTARPAQPASRQAAAPPVPAAPPLPFVYLGQYQEAARPIVFLVRGDRVLPVSQGDVIEGEYRVDEVRGDTLGLTYLPLNIKQTLHMGQPG